MARVCQVDGSQASRWRSGSGVQWARVGDISRRPASWESVAAVPSPSIVCPSQSNTTLLSLWIRPIQVPPWLLMSVVRVTVSHEPLASLLVQSAQELQVVLCASRSELCIKNSNAANRTTFGRTVSSLLLFFTSPFLGQVTGLHRKQRQRHTPCAGERRPSLQRSAFRSGGQRLRARPRSSPGIRRG
jgi:hypothetical protein